MLLRVVLWIVFVFSYEDCVEDAGRASIVAAFAFFLGGPICALTHRRTSIPSV